MHRTHVIATCCYCGSRAALSLGGTTIRHELACSGCGAPLGRMKNLPGGAAAASGTVTGLAGPARKKTSKKTRKGTRKSKKARKRRTLKSRLFDIAEDVLDEIFD